MMVVFDLDDTLYKEADYVESGCRAVAEAIAERCQVPAATFLNIIRRQDAVSKGFDALVDTVGREYPGMKLTVQDILGIYRTHIPDIHLDKSTEDVLRHLAEHDIKMGLITDGRVLTQKAKIHALGLDRYIVEENILISEATGADKHSSMPFEIMMRRNPDESRFVYVGDNPEKDFLWPNRLGWLTVMLLDTDHRNIHSQVIPDDAHCNPSAGNASAVNLYAPALRITSLSALPYLLHNGDYVK